MTRTQRQQLPCHVPAPIETITQCRLIRTFDSNGLVSLDMFAETPESLADPRNNGMEDNAMLSAERLLLRAVKSKHFSVKRNYDIYYIQSDAKDSTPMLEDGSLDRAGEPAQSLHDDREPASMVLVGRVVSNSMGTMYSIYANSVADSTHETTADADSVPGEIAGGGVQMLAGWREICSVSYEVNILGKRGPRKMTAVINAISNNPTVSEMPEMPEKPSSRSELSLMERYRANSDDRDLVVLWNKMPEWCDESRAYVLDFAGRVRVPSVKNFQLMHPDEEEYTVLQFGRFGPDSFTLDMRYPMTHVMALGVAISSIDKKLACN
ncbi:Tubby- protein 2 [Coemansia sp. Benny D115]|nr:Tubby- protein 2 [Coemansia sp. Benny D115]